MRRTGERGEGGRPLRTLKVGEALRHALAEVLARGDLGDPELDRHIVSIPEVRVSPDLGQATVFVMPVGAPAGERERVLAALERHNRRLRHAVASRVQLRRTPQFRYVLDESYDEAARIADVLADPAVRRDTRPDSPDEDRPADVAER